MPDLPKVRIKKWHFNRKGLGLLCIWPHLFSLKQLWLTAKGGVLKEVSQPHHIDLFQFSSIQIQSIEGASLLRTSCSVPEPFLPSNAAKAEAAERGWRVHQSTELRSVPKASGERWFGVGKRFQR